MTPQIPEQNSMKSGTSKRSRAGKERKTAATPKLLLVAATIILAGAAILFWPRGGSVPTGIGEQQSVVVTNQNSDGVTPSSTGQRPHSSSVDIGSESQNIVPESPDGSGLSSKEASAQDVKNAAETQPEKVTKTEAPVKSKPRTKAVSTPEEKIVPQKTGGWAVQVGAYGKAANADKEAVRLQSKGWDARVRAGNNSDGTMVFRVWIGYFKTRSIAEKFARQNKQAVPNAIAVHR